MSESPTGWTNFGGQSQKWHFVAEDGRSLCSRWAMWKTHRLEQGDDDNSDNCAQCRRRMAKRASSMTGKAS